MGCVEGCFLNPIPGSTTPMLVRALGVIARRSILFGKCFTSAYNYEDAETQYGVG